MSNRALLHMITLSILLILLEVGFSAQTDQGETQLVSHSATGLDELSSWLSESYYKNTKTLLDLDIQLNNSCIWTSAHSRMLAGFRVNHLTISGRFDVDAFEYLHVKTLTLTKDDQLLPTFGCNSTIDELNLFLRKEFSIQSIESKGLKHLRVLSVISPKIYCPPLPPQDKSSRLQVINFHVTKDQNHKDKNPSRLIFFRFPALKKLSIRFPDSSEVTRLGLLQEFGNDQNYNVSFFSHDDTDTTTFTCQKKNEILDSQFEWPPLLPSTDDSIQLESEEGIVPSHERSFTIPSTDEESAKRIVTSHERSFTIPSADEESAEGSFSIVTSHERSFTIPSTNEESAERIVTSHERSFTIPSADEESAERNVPSHERSFTIPSTDEESAERNAISERSFTTEHLVLDPSTLPGGGIVDFVEELVLKKNNETEPIVSKDLDVPIDGPEINDTDLEHSVNCVFPNDSVADTSASIADDAGVENMSAPDTSSLEAASTYAEVQSHTVSGDPEPIQRLLGELDDISLEMIHFVSIGVIVFFIPYTAAFCVWSSAKKRIEESTYR